jgi:phage virion morphogenesis protein
MAGAALKLEWEDSQAQAMFGRLIASGSNLRPLYSEIGFALEDSTRKRFDSETAPDGTAWAPISDAWQARKAERGFSEGILKMRGDMLNSVRAEPDSSGVSIIAGPTEYAAIHQFGGQAGRNHAVTLPARPFLGVSDDDGEEIIDAATAFLKRITGD